MSPQIIPLKDPTDLREPSQILATETIRAAGKMPLGPRALQRCRSMAKRRRVAGIFSKRYAIFADPKMLRRRRTSNTIAHFALDFERKESVCGGHGQRAWPACSSPPPAPRGLRGVWVVAAPCCVGTIERSFGMFKRKRGRPRRRLHPKCGRRRIPGGRTQVWTDRGN